jgi:hypothetical protein
VLQQVVTLYRHSVLGWLFGISLIVICCSGDPYFNQYTKTRPEPRQLAGIWRGSNDRYKDIEVMLAEDGSFLVKSYPLAAVILGSDPLSKVNGQGTWAVEQHQSFWIVRLNFNVVGTIARNVGTMVNVLNSRPPYILHVGLEDPDLGKVIELKKKK